MFLFGEGTGGKELASGSGLGSWAAGEPGAGSWELGAARELEGPRGRRKRRSVEGTPRYDRLAAWKQSQKPA